MKLFILSIIILINVALMPAKPVENKAGENIFKNLHLLAKKDGFRNMASIRSVLRKYVELLYPDKNEYQYKRILKALVNKTEEK